jgi:hypothetical protein
VAIRQSGIWQNSSFFADAEDAELGRLQLRKFGEVTGVLGSLCDAIESLSAFILCDLTLYWEGKPTRSCRERWPALATFLI